MPETIDTEILGLSTDGSGVAKVGGRACFVEGAVPGDKVRIALSDNTGIMRAEHVQILQPSPHRVQHPCPHSDRCHGSVLGSLSYDQQLLHKQELVRRTFSKHIGQVDVLPVVASHQRWHYRNRISLTVWAQDDMLELGFQDQARQIEGIAIRTCELCLEPISELLHIVSAYFRKPVGADLPLPRRLQIHQTSDGVGLLLVFIGKIGKDVVKRWEDILSPLHIPGGIWFASGTKAGVVDHREPVVSSNAQLLLTHWLEHEVELHPAAFCQVNEGAANLVLRKIQELASNSHFRQIWDLYGGFGSLGLAAAGTQVPVAVFEVSGFAANTAQALAQQLGNFQLTFVQGDLLKTFPPRAGRLTGDDLLILDPPRSGVHPNILKTILQSKTRDLIYLSCNPARLGRDLALLASGEFRALEIQPFDFFPQTSSQEVLVRLRRT